MRIDKGCIGPSAGKSQPVVKKKLVVVILAVVMMTADLSVFGGIPKITSLQGLRFHNCK
jgi:hypothetical protein